MTEPLSTEEREPIPDAEKLLIVAAWFDVYDSDRDKAKRLLDDSGNPDNDAVQADLRRIAASLATQEADTRALREAGIEWIAARHALEASVSSDQYTWNAAKRREIEATAVLEALLAPKAEETPRG